MLRPAPPQWVQEAMPQLRHAPDAHGAAVHAGALTWLSAAIPHAGDLDAGGLREAVARLYTDLGRALAGTGSTAIRMWNYLPGPTAPMAPGLDRYMVFNEGRRLGYRQWFTGDGFEAVLPTASAVGVPGPDLVVHCLASRERGRAVQNPRQKPSWQYSARFGPVAPTFSRATIAAVDGRTRLLIGGTASIVGEESVHVGHLEAQLDETLRNLAALVASARAHAESAERSLSRLRDLRVYVARARDAGVIGDRLSARLDGLARLEMAAAPLCRPELLVEIEGVADLDP